MRTLAVLALSWVLVLTGTVSAEPAAAAPRATLSGTVIADADELAAGTFTVWASSLFKNTEPVVVAADGTWTLTDLAPWDWSLHVEHEGSIPILYGEDNRTRSIPIKPAEGEVIDGIEIVWQEKTALTVNVNCGRCSTSGDSRREANLRLQEKRDGVWADLGPASLERLSASSPWERNFFLFPGTYRFRVEPFDDDKFQTVVSKEVTLTGGRQTLDVVYRPEVSKWDLTGDGDRLFLVRPTGELRAFPMGDFSQLGKSARIGTGRSWLSYSTIMLAGDFDGDACADILARDKSGGLWLFRGNGAGGLRSRVKVGSGMQKYTALVAPGDISGDGKPDLLGRTASGALVMLRGDGAGGWAGTKTLSSGWNSYKLLIAPGDVDGDGHADLIARRSNGDMYLFHGDGHAHLTSPVRIGTGWNKYSQAVGAGEFGGASQSSLVGIAKYGFTYRHAMTSTGRIQGDSIAAILSNVRLVG
ncbi:VCBS repeat-containing protein [Homoserinibacter sp. GY 40078]|uniref:FG-GAP repeat domain-containing protein n=1 Tax=Homoserinibacter sp. GY 40078 TaxID=2603275 RepID=UPI0011C901B8|nr:VCBS repeat-containing protein [Homoserinibacter sp. GY 40078]TXK16327.1 VCBS repeat-containing protein [Homoserinibacter sp. GY 40078]